MAFPKVNLNKDVKKHYKHNMSCLSSTTSDFGFLQPVKSYLLSPQSKVSYEINSSARLAPLPVPTFGKVELKNYSAFVPMTDIMPAWDCMQANQSFRGIVDYIPESVPTISNVKLRNLVLYSACVTAYRLSDSTIGSGDNYITYRRADSDWQSFGTLLNIEHYENEQVQILLAKFYCQVMSIITNISDASYLYIPRTAGYNMCLPPYVTSLFNSQFGNSYDCQPFYCGENASDDVPSGAFYSEDNWFGGQSTIQSADYVAIVKGASHTGSSDEYYNALCFKYSKITKNLVKILQGLGYQLNEDTRPKSILPLLAFYKAYYDEFAPRRYDNWCDTYCAGLINYFTQNGLSDVGLVCSLSGTNLFSASNVEISELFAKFLYEELAMCYYTEDNTYLNSHIDTLAINNDNDSNNSFVINEPLSSPNGVTATATTIMLPHNEQVVASVNSGLSGIMIQSLLKLTRFINKNSVIGGRIDEYFKTHFGVSAFEDVPHRTMDSIDLNIDEVFSTNESDDVNLGEFAGRGYGRGSSQSYTFTANKHGYLIIMQCVVPSLSSFYQGEDVTLNALTRFDFPQPQFDALGMESTPVSAICAEQFLTFVGDAGGNIVKPDFSAGFGYIPRYSGFKQSKPIVNGDLNRRGTRDTLSAYHLQRMMTLDKFSYHISSTDAGLLELSIMNTQQFVAGTWLKYLSMYPQLSNYDRIFYNNGDNSSYFENVSDQISDLDVFIRNVSMVFEDDNFICHSFVNCTIWSPFKSLSDSFDDESENSDNVVKVEHS